MRSSLNLSDLGRLSTLWVARDARNLSSRLDKAVEKRRFLVDVYTKMRSFCRRGDSSTCAHSCVCLVRCRPVNWSRTHRVPGASTSVCWRTSKPRGSSGRCRRTWSAGAAWVSRWLLNAHAVHPPTCARKIQLTTRRNSRPNIKSSRSSYIYLK